jgi:beta-glucosidase
LLGPLADSARDMLGSWAARGNATDVVNLRAALSSRMKKSGGSLLYAKGTEIDGTSDAGFAEARGAALKSGLVIVALGERADTMTGEAASRSRLDLPGNQQQLLESVVATGKPIVLIVFSGRPLALTWAAEHVSAIIEAWMPGVQAGPALDRALFGEANFSGKLTVSFPRAVGQEPLYYNALNTGRPIAPAETAHTPATRSQRYTSRYVDERNDALFPFGFGLSYSNFSYGPVTLSASQLSARQLNSANAPRLHVSAEVTNDGTRDADEIVQLYIEERGTSIARPVRELKGFQRIHVGPGESRRVEFVIGPEELKIWNTEMRYIAEPANVNVWIAPSSVAGSQSSFIITD